MDKWWLGIYLVGTAIMSFALVYAFVLARRGQRGPLEYVPGIILVIIGLGINIFGHLSIIPLPFSKYVIWPALVTVAAGVIILERKWRGEKIKGPRK
jgi:hypothetical protein